MTGWRRAALVTVAAAALAGAPRSVSAAPNEPLFAERADALGLADERAGRVVLQDLDGDGAPEVILDGARPYTLAPAGDRLRPVTPWPAPPEGVRPPTAVLFGDLDDDGRVDQVWLRSTDLSREGFEDDGLRHEVWLARPGGRFTRVERSGLEAHAETTISGCLVDYDLDGILDLFIGSAYTAYGKSLEAFPDRLFRGRGDGTFEDVTEAAGLLGAPEVARADSRRPTYGVTHGDWNGDGRPDLFVLTYGRQWNRLWRNDGDGTFTDVAVETTFDGDDVRHGRHPPGVPRETEAPFRANGNTFDGALADFDGDGDLDVVLAEIAHWWAGDSSDRTTLLENLGPSEGHRFRRRPDLLPARPHEGERWNEGDMHAGWLDADLDGRLDLLIASSDYPDDQRLRLYRQRPAGGFEDATPRLGIAWRNACQISLGDLDRDGATDILVGTNHHRLTKEQRDAWPLKVGLLRGLAADRGTRRFVSIRLAGLGRGHANRDAIGARVTIVAGERRQMREVQGGLGHAAHRDDLSCRFGLGTADRIDRVEVRWPDREGSVQVFEDVAVDRFYRLEQGGALETVRGRW